MHAGGIFDHGRVTLMRGDARNLQLADASVDLVITSPPYWALRSYQDGGDPLAHQIGAEATPAAYVDSLIECTREWVRVLKPSGSIWVNLGDKYAGAPSGPAGSSSQTFVGCKRAQNWTRRGAKAAHGVPQKSLVGLPWRYALRCIDDLGLILRAEVIWSKPNGLPESVTDRVRRSHETWFHFTKSPRYFAAVDYVREQYAPATSSRYASGYKSNARDDAGQQSSPSVPVGVADLTTNPLGKLPGSVWTIATQPLRVPAELGVDHFAAFPMEWPRRIILGWSPSGVCTGCGEGRRPVATRTTDGQVTRGHISAVPGKPDGREGARKSLPVVVTGEACACPDTSAATTPAVVLDPFGGTGTTALVAAVHGRHGISVDLSGDYSRIAAWRTSDPAQIERAGRAAGAKPGKRARAVDITPTLFDEGAA